MKHRIKEIKVLLEKMSCASLFFYLFVFCLPFFKRVEISSGYSYLDGRFIDYLTYSIYGFEILFVMALLFWAIEIIRYKKNILLGDVRIFFAWGVMFLFSLFSLFFAESVLIGFYYIFILLELILLYLFVINKINRADEHFLLLNVFLFSMFLQSVIAIFQFIKNGSLGFYLLGEQIISPEIDGVAKTLINGARHIRPYGTFSHPNVLALFLLIAGLIALYLFFKFTEKRYKIYLILAITVLTIALLLTFSRIAWLAGLIFWGGFIFQEIRKSIPRLYSGQGKQKINFKKILSYSLIFLIPLLIILIYLAPSIWLRINPFLDVTWESLNIRGAVLLKSFVLIKTHLLGVGIGNFTIEAAYLLTGYPVWMVEPAHNVFVLVLAEIGTLGLASFLAFLYFIVKSLKHVSLFLKYVFALFVFLMFFDHYFWDIRQAQILLFLFFGVMAINSLKKELL